MGKTENNRTEELIKLWYDFQWEVNPDTELKQFLFSLLAVVNQWEHASKLFRWIVSKESGFVKCLFDKDKINYDKLEEFKWNDYDHFNNEESLLQILALEDHPLNYLAELLKQDE